MDHGGGGGGGGRAEAERWLGIAEKLLGARDLVGSKRFAERALESDPLLDGVDQILAIADVLLAAQRRVNNQVDWYSILQLDPSAGGRDPSAVKRQYRRLALLLHPDRNKAPGADIAFRLVVDAWAVLSDPSKKTLFDSELEIAAAHLRSNGPPSDHPPLASSTAANDPTAFWTACPLCCHVYLYARAYCNRKLSCPTCRQAFHAAEISVPPPIVPGTDMYYSSWGFFPLGFPGGPGFHEGLAPNSTTGVPGSGWKPFYPMFPSWGNQPTPPFDRRNGVDGVGELQAEKGSGPKENVVEPGLTAPARNRKKMARKNVGISAKKRVSAGEADPKCEAASELVMPEPTWEKTEKKPADININEEVKVIDVDEEFASLGGAEMNNIHIDLDATEELLGNLQNIPFLKDEEIQIQIP